ncbi:MAG: peptide-methionine (S)-S-oxide reductase MsrA [Pseudomonadota bacterium]
MRLYSLLFLALAACANDKSDLAAAEGPTVIPDSAKSLVVAGGCFWCVESDFEKREGVYEVTSGYSGGELRNATYQNHDGHREVVEIYYDPQVTGYATLVDEFLRSVDVLDPGGQFCDRGYSYSTAVHYRNEEEKTLAEEALQNASEVLGAPLATKAEPFNFFVTAEEYHQDYYKKNPVRYKFYRSRCGRDSRVKEVWGDAAFLP